MGWFQRVSPIAGAVAIEGLALAPLVAQDTPTFTSDIELVTVDAVVLDDDGTPVAGLRPEDFDLRDEGERREILTFEALDSAAVPVALTTEARRVATNVTAESGRVMAVFWDDVHLTPPFAERARKALSPWLTQRLAQGDRIVLASASGAWQVADDARGGESLLGLLDALEGASALPAGDPEYVSDYEATAISEMNDTLTYEVVYRRFAARGVIGCGSARLGPGELW